jgi:hypothetical protein
MASSTRLNIAAASKRSVAFNDDKLTEVLGGPNVAVANGTVIKQDPPPGTPIARGGGVTLTIARTRDFPMGIIAGIDPVLDQRKIGEIYDEVTRSNPAPVLKIFEDVEDYADLSEAQRAQVDHTLAQFGVQGATGYKGIQGALALGALG